MNKQYQCVMLLMSLIISLQSIAQDIPSHWLTPLSCVQRTALRPLAHDYAYSVADFYELESEAYIAFNVKIMRKQRSEFEDTTYIPMQGVKFMFSCPSCTTERQIQRTEMQTSELDGGVRTPLHRRETTVNLLFPDGAIKAGKQGAYLTQEYYIEDINNALLVIDDDGRLSVARKPAEMSVYLVQQATACDIQQPANHAVISLQSEDGQLRQHAYTDDTGRITMRWPQSAKHLTIGTKNALGENDIWSINTVLYAQPANYGTFVVPDPSLNRLCDCENVKFSIPLDDFSEWPDYQLSINGKNITPVKAAPHKHPVLHHLLPHRKRHLKTHIPLCKAPNANHAAHLDIVLSNKYETYQFHTQVNTNKKRAIKLSFNDLLLNTKKLFITQHIGFSQYNETKTSNISFFSDNKEVEINKFVTTENDDSVTIAMSSLSQRLIDYDVTHANNIQQVVLNTRYDNGTDWSIFGPLAVNTLSVELPSVLTENIDHTDTRSVTTSFQGSTAQTSLSTIELVKQYLTPPPQRLPTYYIETHTSTKE